eukprot:9470681-Pyramimonas_sp.AAC.1
MTSEALTRGHDANPAAQLDHVIVGSEVHAVTLAHKTDRVAACRLRRALVSHIVHQARGLASMISGTLDRGCHDLDCASVIAVNVFDDASMWVTRQKASESNALETLSKTLALQQKQRGGRVHKTVLNLCETIFVERHVDGMQFWCGAEVASPAQPLPKGNAATIRERWAKWSAMSAIGAGSSVDPEYELRKILDGVSWKVIVMNKDNLGLNNNIVAMEQAVLKVQHATTDSMNYGTTLLPL